jgi:endonuclease YncB( thermonuclease family)
MRCTDDMDAKLIPHSAGQSPSRRGARGLIWAVLALSAVANWALSAGPGLAGEIAGKPRVVDAGTLDFSGRIVRLHGVDAPKAGQTCRAGGQAWSCGRDARWAAINRIGGHWVTCVEKSQAGDGSSRAVCYLAGAGQHDLGAWLVREGWALADPALTPGYTGEQAAARKQGKGVWRGGFVPPVGGWPAQ